MKPMNGEFGEGDALNLGENQRVGEFFSGDGNKTDFGLMSVLFEILTSFSNCMSDCSSACVGDEVREFDAD